MCGRCTTTDASFHVRPPSLSTVLWGETLTVLTAHGWASRAALNASQQAVTRAGSLSQFTSLQREQRGLAEYSSERHVKQTRK